MLKKNFLLLFAITIINTAYPQKNTKSSTLETVIIVGGLGALGVTAAILIGPVILPASTVAAIKATAATAAVKATAAAATAKSAAIAAPVGLKVGVGIAAAKYARPHIFPTAQEESTQLQKEEDEELKTARDNFINCLRKNKNSTKKNTSGRPVQCEELAKMLGMLSNLNEVNNITKSIIPN